MSVNPERTRRVPPILCQPQRVQPQRVQPQPAQPQPAQPQPAQPQPAQAISPTPFVMALPLLTNSQPFSKTVKLSAPGLTLMIV